MYYDHRCDLMQYRKYVDLKAGLEKGMSSGLFDFFDLECDVHTGTLSIVHPQHWSYAYSHTRTAFCLRQTFAFGPSHVMLPRKILFF